MRIDVVVKMDIAMVTTLMCIISKPYLSLQT